MDRKRMKELLEHWPFAIFRRRMASKHIREMNRELRQLYTERYLLPRSETTRWETFLRERIQKIERELTAERTFLAVLNADVRHLPDKYQRILRVKYRTFGRPSWDEVAEKVHCTPNQARQWHVKAVNQLVEIENSKEDC